MVNNFHVILVIILICLSFFLKKQLDSSSSLELRFMSALDVDNSVFHHKSPVIFSDKFNSKSDVVVVSATLVEYIPGAVTYNTKHFVDAGEVYLEHPWTLLYNNHASSVDLVIGLDDQARLIELEGESVIMLPRGWRVDVPVPKTVYMITFPNVVSSLLYRS